MPTAIHYTIVPLDLGAHLFDVSVTVPEPHAEGQIFTLPAWVPGSYMIREFSRHIVQLEARSGGRKITVKKLDKHTWQAAPCTDALTLHYQVYAWDLSVRAAHLDQTHGFFNGASVFLSATGCENLAHVVDIQRCADSVCKGWRVATALPELKAKRYGFGTYIADNYDDLIDHPVEMGAFELVSFSAHGVPHEMAVTGKTPNLDTARMAGDLKKICEAQIALFEPNTKRAPMNRYVFLTMVVGEGYGGLEHRASTALLCSRNDLPVKKKEEMSNGYRNFLGLCSHEYFHTWNVKRIKPAAFAPYDLSREAYTPLLWLFEGFTSYYDDLMLVRSGVIDDAAYAKLLAKPINGVLRGSGRRKQSVAESSFDAWTKYYRQDENSPNAIVSYYAKGSLVALALDLTIRAQSKGRKSLNDVMRALWRRYGRDFYTSRGGRGVSEAEVGKLFDEVTSLSLKRTLDQYVNGTADLPLAKLLQPFGIELDDKRDNAKPVLGVRTIRDGNDCKLANVYEGGAAHRAGLSAADVLIAIDDARVTADNVDTLLARYRVGDSITLYAFRRDELMTFTVKLKADDAPQIQLSLREKPLAAQRMRHMWLGK